MRAFTIVNRILFGAALPVVIVATLLPAADLPPVGISDKLEHVIAYAGLAFLGSNAFPGSIPRRVVLLALFILGCGLELLQTFVPGRYADVGDVLANTAGLVLGVAVQASGRWLIGARRGGTKEQTQP